MSDQGVFGIHRGIWDHPIFKERKPKEYSRREAWIWMVSEAAWKPRRVRIPGSTFMLARGQIAHSIRFMAKAWGWEQTRAVRFLEQLKTEAMIATRIEAGQNVTTICNYDRYQVVGLPDATADATPIATPAQQDRNASATNNKKEIKEEDSGGGTRASLISQVAHDLSVDLAQICGFPSIDDWPPGWCGSPLWVQKCLNEGWLPEVMVTETRAVAMKRDGPIEHFKYLEKPLARAQARHQAPLPKVETPQQETIRGANQTAGNRPGNILDAAREMRRQLSGNEDRNTVLSLSKG